MKKEIVYRDSRVKLEGNRLNASLEKIVGINIQDPEDALTLDIHVSCNLETGAVVGDTLSRLAFLALFIAPVLEELGLLPDGEAFTPATAEQVSDFFGELNECMHTIDKMLGVLQNFVRSLGSGELPGDAEDFMGVIERVLRNIGGDLPKSD